LTAKRYKVLQIRVKYHSIKTIKPSYLFAAVPAGSQEVTVALNFVSERTLFSAERLGERLSRADACERNGLRAAAQQYVNPAAFAHLTVFLPCILSVRCWEFM
jgi:hypothetical protein